MSCGLNIDPQWKVHLFKFIRSRICFFYHVISSQIKKIACWHKKFQISDLARFQQIKETSPCLTRSLKPHNYIKWQGSFDNKYGQTQAKKKEKPLECSGLITLLTERSSYRCLLNQINLWLSYEDVLWPFAATFRGSCEASDRQGMASNQASPFLTPPFVQDIKMSWRHPLTNQIKRFLSLEQDMSNERGLSKNKQSRSPIGSVWWPFFEHQTCYFGNILRSHTHFLFLFLFVFFLALSLLSHLDFILSS